MIKPNTLCMIIVHSPATLTLPEYMGRTCVTRSLPFPLLDHGHAYVVHVCEFPDGSRHWVDACALKPLTGDGQPDVARVMAREPERVGGFR